MDGHHTGKPKAEPYEAPAIRTLSADELLELVGPAQGYGGSASRGHMPGIARKGMLNGT